MDAIRILLTAALFAATLAYASLPTMPEIPTFLPDSIRAPLVAKRQPLALRKLALIEEGKALNQSCANVEKGSSQHQSCLAKQAQYNAKARTLGDEMDRLADEVNAIVAKHTINSMNALAKHLGWRADEQARLAKALNSLATDGNPIVTNIQVRHVWQDIFTRGQDEKLAKEAGQSEGPVFPGAGTQSFEDCTLFALANAAGLPYGAVAARATKLIKEGEWRDAAERANPQKSIEEQGLNGGEVVMLTETFGQVEVVPSSDFAKTLKEGRPVMVSVMPSDGNFDNGHQVVLTKTFQHGGETWYEMMDSNQGPQQRRYLSANELSTIQNENGVAYRPESGATPKLLR